MFIIKNFIILIIFKFKVINYNLYIIKNSKLKTEKNI